jgi:DNA modification methylase
MAHPVAERALAHFDALFPIDEPLVPTAQPEQPSISCGGTELGQPEAIIDQLLAEFTSILERQFYLRPELRAQCLEVITKIDSAALKPKSERFKGLFYSVKNKLKLNAKRAQRLYDLAASRSITFNYREKADIIACLDRNDLDGVKSVLRRKPRALVELCSILNNELPVSDEDSLSALKRECQQTTNPRSKEVDYTMTNRMLEAMFSGFFFESFERQSLHYAIVQKTTPYEPDYWRYLHDGREHLFDRENAIWFAHIDQSWVSGHYEQLRERVSSFVTEAYAKLSNHGVLCLFIDKLTIEGRSRSWELAADVTLYAERFDTEVLDKGYFQRAAIEEECRRYIAELGQSAGAFEVANGGFSYMDCIVTRANPKDATNRMLLIFQKHLRDETLLPCPACRSTNVQGNSYSSLGIRSWECQNYVCSERSKSNRGKRYSFLSLLKQRALEDEKSVVPAESIQMWRRDVVLANVDDALEMVVRHYSIAGDKVVALASNAPNAIAGRRIHTAILPEDGSTLFKNFSQSPFFDRFLVEKATINQPNVIEKGDDNFKVLQGDAYEALQTLNENSVDGAVTSPPYYNAREYAQWSNIYCHMYDMFNIARQVFRVLKPGSLYLYNLFDYFDNDRTITFSAMGDKRLSLSALTVHAFRSAGFWMMGNIVWDKGEIEGKRGFNRGNASPYYQAPFNCWEHVLVFAKPGTEALSSFSKLPTYLRCKPVIKMVRGQNTHGHTAPFPDAIPELLTSLLPKDACVIDPFAGSMTTGRVAERRGLRSISIERDADFVELGLRMRREEQSRLNFFDAQDDLVK